MRAHLAATDAAADRPVLVTGASGFVGLAVCRRLAAESARFVAVCRPGRADTVRAHLGPHGQAVEVDATDADALRRALAGVQPAALIHCAAAGVHPGRREVEPLVAGNVGLTLAWLRFAAAAGVDRFVHVGSCSEFGRVTAAPIPAEAPTQPTSAYGGAKAAASQLALGVGAALGLRVTVVRLFGVYGPGEGDHRLLPQVFFALERGQRLPMTAGTQVRDLLFVDDAARGLLAVARAVDAPAGRCLNLCTGQGVQVRALARRAAALWPADAALLDFGALPTRGDEPEVLVGDPSALTAATGFTATTSLDEGLLATLVAFRAATPRGAHG